MLKVSDVSKVSGIDIHTMYIKANETDRYCRAICEKTITYMLIAIDLKSKPALLIIKLHTVPKNSKIHFYDVHAVHAYGTK